jgi:hypothetical protein
MSLSVFEDHYETINEAILELLETKEKYDIFEFSKAVGIINNNEFVTKFFINLDRRYPIHLDKYLIDSFGYKGTLPENKRAITDLLKKRYSLLEGKQWKKFNNKEYINYYGSLTETQQSLYPDPSEFKGHGKDKYHFIMSVDIYKRLLMSAQTSESDKIHSYFINLEHTIQMYGVYINAFEIKQRDAIAAIKAAETKMLLNQKNKLIIKHKSEVNSLTERLTRMEAKLDKSLKSSKIIELETKSSNRNHSVVISELKTANSKLDKVTGLMTHRVQNNVIPENKKHCVTILKIMKNNKLNHYHTIRVQRIRLNKSIGEVETEYGKKNVTVLKNIDYYPNPIDFWIQFKVKFASTLVAKGNDFKLRIEEDVFVALIEYYMELRILPENDDTDADDIIDKVRDELYPESDPESEESEEIDPEDVSAESETE